MWWVSNRKSVENTEPSALAIAETVVACSLSICFALYSNSVIHILAAACISPLLLMRTSYSDRFAFAVRGWFRPKRTTRLKDAFTVMVAIPTLIQLGRVFGGVAAMVTHPVASVNAIPRNWQRICIATDFRHDPEIAPGRDSSVHSEGEIYSLISSLIAEKGVKDWTDVAALLVGLLYVSLLIVPPFLYQLALKSTAIIWLPLLWALRPIAEKGTRFSNGLHLLAVDPLKPVVMAASEFTLLAFPTKLYIAARSANFVEWWNQTSMHRLFALYVVPEKIPVWQVAMFVNSILFFVTWYVVSSALIRVRADLPVSESVIGGAVQSLYFVRRLLTTYTIACTFYILFREVATWSLPPLGDKLFPWM